MSPRLLRSLVASVCVCIAACGIAHAADARKDGLNTLIDKAGAAEFRGEYASARSVYTQATEQFRDSSEAWAALGEHLRFYVHDSSAATAAFNTALAAKDQSAYAVAFAWRGLGELALKSGRVDEGLGCFKKSLASCPLADTHRSLCHHYCSHHKFKEAAEAAKAAVELNPDDAIARLLFAAQLHRAGEKERAENEFQKALGIGGMDAHGNADKPVHCCVLYNAAGYLSVAGKHEAALAMLRRFFETPNHRHLSREDIVGDSDFEGLSRNAAFQTLIATHFNTTKPGE